VSVPGTLTTQPGFEYADWSSLAVHWVF